ncbi:MAG TPA: GON domain-containing protein [Kofleriaceae bacterium]|nr:GON domain-containing protein [Kofleriaceae bacterium]
MRPALAVVTVMAGCAFRAGTESGDAGAQPPEDAGITVCTHAGCPAACQVTANGPVCYTPTSCAEAQAHGQPANADTTLYANGNATQPWTAYCNGADEYLTVAAVNNYGQYAAGGASSGTTVTTNYSKLRIDPTSWKIDVNDETFAMSSGGPLTHGSSGLEVQSMPLAVAMDCVTNYSATGLAEIALGGTPFVVTNRWTDFGNKGSGSATASDSATISITGGGFCGWDAPVGYVGTTGGNPFNPTGVSATVAVSYAP